MRPVSVRVSPAFTGRAYSNSCSPWTRVMKSSPSSRNTSAPPASPGVMKARGSTTRPAGRGRSIHPAIHGAHARLGHQEVVADRLAAAVLDGAWGGDQTEDPARLVAMVGLRVGVHLEVPDRQAVVPLEPLV